MTGDRIHLLYVIDNLSFGGGEQGILQLCDQLPRDRFDIRVAATPGGRFGEALRERDITFYPIDMSRQVNFAAIRQIGDIVSGNRIDIVHSEGARADFFSAMALRRITGVHLLRTIAMLPERFDVSWLRRRLYRVFERYGESRNEIFITVSRALRRHLIENHGIPEEKVIAVPNGIDLETFRPDPERRRMARAQLGIDEEILLIGGIGRLVFQKGFSTFVRAASIVSERLGNVKFMLVGEGPDAQALQALASELDLEKTFHFAGARYDVPELLAAFDVLAIPSILEGMPRITLEGMALGKSIVATDIEGIQEQLEDGSTAFLVPPNNDEAFAGALLKLLADPDLREAFGKNARQEAELRFDLRQAIEQYRKIYEGLLSA